METLGEGSPHPKVRVLVADNEEIIAKTLAAILNLAGYEVCAVYDGDAAVKLLDMFTPNLIITDLDMPGVTGTEVAYTARAVIPRCKILLFTGQTALHHLLGNTPARDLPFTLLTKPILTAELLALLTTLLSGDKPPLLMPIEVDEINTH